jgi:hypothetical protein
VPVRLLRYDLYCLAALLSGRSSRHARSTVCSTSTLQGIDDQTPRSLTSGRLKRI